MPRHNRHLRGIWAQENMSRALEAVRSGMAIYRASITFDVPRRTLRRYLEENKEIKASLGRKPVLSTEQESELSQRIVRLSQVGYPLTPRVLRACVYRYAKTNNLTNPFRNDKEMAGRYWLRGFLSRNPQIRPRTAQNLNPARAQKLNPYIVKDHFSKLEVVLKELDIIDKPERIFNLDEKGCRLCLHHKQKVLAEKGARRVHSVGNEHGENVTIVACANALGTAVPPMILFKGKRMKPEWKDMLPPGSEALMTQKGSMTIATFCAWIEHFSKFKPNGKCLLIFDGAKCHLDYTILETATRYDVTLYCLPSNTTHELQPMDKAVFRAFEYYWEDEVQKYLSIHKGHTITKQRFGSIFTKVWDRTMTPGNIKSGFEATGIYPFNKDAIPEIAFAPSSVTAIRNHDEQAEAANAQVPLVTTVSPTINNQPTTSGLQRQKTAKKQLRVIEDSSDSDIDLSLHDESSDEYSDIHEDNDSSADVSFKEMLTTPDEVYTKRKTPRKPAINCKAQVIKKDLFDASTRNVNVTDKRVSKKNKNSNNKESWYCKLCREDRVADMRLCTKCLSYVHEECVGLTGRDKLKVFLCPSCET